MAHTSHTWRKLITVTIACSLLTLTACAPPAITNEKPTVLTTFTVLQDMAQNVAGNHLNVESLTKPGAEIHEYEPTPSDVKKAHDADLVLNNGLHLEAWFEQFMQDSEAKHVTVSDGVKPLSISEDAAAGTDNPHAWMSPRLAQTYVDNIARAFSELDPEHAEDFTKNANSYKQELQGIEQKLTQELSTLPEEHKALVTCEGAFSYLAQYAGLTEKYLWAVNSDSEVSAARLAEVSDYVKDNKVPAVFCESTVSDASMQQVVSDAGTKFGGTLYVDSLSDEAGEVPTYLELLRHDTETISKGLSRK